MLAKNFENKILTGISAQVIFYRRAKRRFMEDPLRARRRWRAMQRRKNWGNY